MVIIGIYRDKLPKMAKQRRKNQRWPAVIRRKEGESGKERKKKEKENKFEISEIRRFRFRV